MRRQETLIVVRARRRAMPDAGRGSKPPENGQRGTLELVQFPEPGSIQQLFREAARWRQ